MPRCLPTWLAWLLPAIALLLSCCAALAAPAGAPRLALVVGNAAYPAKPLATVANDAALVAQALAQAGFDVTAARDLDAARLRATLAAFVEAARAAGPEATLFVYFAGYGVQYTGGNYLVPVDARLVHDDDVPAETASLDDFIHALAAVPAKVRLVVVDASRAQPFATADEMPLAPGLGLVAAPRDGAQGGTIVAFAAAPDMVAPDTALPYGAYARALAETIAAPGVSTNALVDRVRLRVGMRTNGEQVPWDDGTDNDDVALTPAVAPAPPVAASPPPAAGGLSPDNAYSVVIARDTLASYTEFLRVVPDGPLATRIRVLQAIRREATMWQAAATSSDPRAAWTYMRRYPRAPHRFDARRRLAALHAAIEPPPRFDPFVFPLLPPPTAAELALVAAPGAALRGLPPIPAPPTNLLPPADPAYYDELPMPAPAPAGLLPIAPPLPGAAGGETGRIAQSRPDGGLTVSETQLTPNGSGSVTLADAAGPILELVASDAFGDARMLVETSLQTVAPAPSPSLPPVAPSGTKPGDTSPGPKAGTKTAPPVLSRTIVRRTAEGVTMAQVGANGETLLEVTTRTEADGTHTTRVTNGDDEQRASWRRDAQGIVVARDASPVVADATPAPATPVPATPAPSPATTAPATAGVVPPRPTPAPAPVLPPAAPPAPPAVPPQRADPPRAQSPSPAPANPVEAKPPTASAAPAPPIASLPIASPPRAPAPGSANSAPAPLRPSTTPLPPRRPAAARPRPLAKPQAAPRKPPVARKAPAAGRRPAPRRPRR